MVFHEVNSFLKWKATGAVATDIGNAYVKSFDPELDAFYAEVMDVIGLPREKFPKVVRCDEFVAETDEKGAEELGLVPGIPVFGGDTDLIAIAVGSGCGAIGDVHMYFGSSGGVGYTAPHGPEKDRAPFDYERDISIYGLQAIGLSLNWAVRTFWAKEFEELGDGVYDLINEELKEIPAGSLGVMSSPWFYAERKPLYDYDARGVFVNLGPQHDRRHMTKAVMESVCYALKAAMEVQQGMLGYETPNVINVCGGGACSDIWMQALADVMQIRIRVPYSPRHAGAVGTAYCALVGLGICKDYTDVNERVKIERTFDPIPENVKVYEKMYPVYRNLYGMLQPLFSALNR